MGKEGMEGLIKKCIDHGFDYWETHSFGLRSLVKWQDAADVFRSMGYIISEITVPLTGTHINIHCCIGFIRLSDEHTGWTNQFEGEVPF